jgi:hypothetical protein
MTGLRQYGYIGALVALTLSLDDMDFLEAKEESDLTVARPLASAGGAA